MATAATRLAIEAARETGRHRAIHAFPNVENAPSNAICAKVGFTLLGRQEFEFPPGNLMRCNDWRLDLGARAPPREHPRLERDVARDGRGGPGRDQHAELERARRRRVEPVQDGERAAGQPEREHEHDRADRVLAQQAGAAADAEGQPPVGGGVADRGQRERGAFAPAAPSGERSSRNSSA